jgi:putative ABC transport system permease protein
MRIFESTFTITYALQVIAIVVAGLGVASTLITLIYQRQREIGMLSLIGATCRQVRRVIMIEAVILGAVSQFIGVSVGVVLALVLIFVINVQSFGWTIQVHVPWWFLAQSTVFVIIAAATFGLYPAVRAASVDALQTVREE